MVRYDPIIPQQLGQNSGTGLGRGQDVVSGFGISVTGGSTVAPGASAPGMLSAATGAPVYMGMGGLAGNTSDPTGAHKQGAQPNYLGFDEANLLPTTWSDKQLKEFVNKGILYKVQGFTSDMGMPEIVNAWGNLIDSAQAFSQGGAKWTPWDVLETYNQKPGAFGTVKSADGDWLLDARTGDKIKYIGPRSKTTTSKHIDLSSPEDVRALATQQLTELLGRAPTSEEMSKYRTAISGFEKANPENTTTTTTINDQGEAVGESSTTTGGVSDAARASLIGDQAKQGPEYGKYQGATTYFNAMMQMLGG